MKHHKVRVAVNGYGVIGKRIADAITAQEDMEVVGVADVSTDWRIKVAYEKGYPLYAATPQALAEMRAVGIPVAGTLAELLGKGGFTRCATLTGTDGNGSWLST